MPTATKVTRGNIKQLGKSFATKSSIEKQRILHKKFADMCVENGLPRPILEWQFAKLDLKRNWQADFCWLQTEFHKFGGGVILEDEGGVYSKGRHTRPQGFLGDIEKYNNAQLLNYIVLRCVPAELCFQKTIEMIRKALVLKELIKK